jgi:hypothetical protein
MRNPLRASALAALAALAVGVLALRPDVSSAGAAPPTTATAAQPAAAQPAGAADLALVPADAVGFAHVRLADMWKNEVMSGFRKTWERAGPKALAALDKQFVPAPSTISRATAFVMLDPKKGPQPVGIFAFSAPFDRDALLKSYLPNHTTEKAGGKTVYRTPDIDVELYFPDDRTVVVGWDGSLEAYLAKAPAKDGPLAPALKLAASGTKVVVASADISALPIPPDALKDVPADAAPILKARQLTLAIDLGADARFDVRAAYADEAAAQDAEKAVKALTDLGRKELAKAKKEIEDKLYDPNVKTPRPAQDLPEAIGMVFSLGALGRLDDTLADQKFITRKGTELALAVPMPKEILTLAGGAVALGAAALVPAVGKVRVAAARTQSANNLKQIGIAIHSYHDAYGHMPTDILDKNGKPILSWRVAILPFIEQDALYKQFKLDEPWDSANNKQWSQVMIKTFLSPDTPLPPKPEWGMTSYRAVSGPGAAFEPGKKLRLTDFTDGTSNTIMVVETNDLVPWAKPGDYPFDPKKDLPKINPPGKRDVFQALFGDGSVRAIKPTISEKTLKALFTRNGGEVIPDIDKEK